MQFIKKLIEFFKKIGLLKTHGSAGKFTSSKDENYKPPDPLDN